jgi:hypothetical protein
LFHINEVFMCVKSFVSFQKRVRSPAQEHDP